MTKICTLCKQQLPLDSFAKKGSGVQARCRQCHSLYTKKHYIENKQYYVNKATKNSKKYKASIDKYKESTPCADCGGNFPSECMDFDHISGKKEFNISSKRHYGLSKSVLEEMAKCELVCANCHRTRTKNRKQK